MDNFHFPVILHFLKSILAQGYNYPAPRTTFNGQLGGPPQTSTGQGYSTTLAGPFSDTTDQRKLGNYPSSNNGDGYRSSNVGRYQSTIPNGQHTSATPAEGYPAAGIPSGPRFPQGPKRPTSNQHQQNGFSSSSDQKSQKPKTQTNGYSAGYAGQTTRPSSERQDFNENRPGYDTNAVQNGYNDYQQADSHRKSFDFGNGASTTLGYPSSDQGVPSGDPQSGSNGKSPEFGSRTSTTFGYPSASPNIRNGYQTNQRNGGNSSITNGYSANDPNAYYGNQGNGIPNETKPAFSNKPSLAANEYTFPGQEATSATGLQQNGALNDGKFFDGASGDENFIQNKEGEDEGDYSAIPGQPDIDYPILSYIPETSFSCDQQEYPGYYADIETRCQVFHICANSQTYDFLCPNGTIFHQEYLVCVWWNQFDCNSAPALFNTNSKLYDGRSSQSQGEYTISGGGSTSGNNDGYGQNDVNGNVNFSPDVQSGYPQEPQRPLTSPQVPNYNNFPKSISSKNPKSSQERGYLPPTQSNGFRPIAAINNGQSNGASMGQPTKSNEPSSPGEYTNNLQGSVNAPTREYLPPLRK
ncbi:hypothetical protein ABEB36_012053 [Hypothenemus hampei]|uniref:Chitin-binding type-2 domain-containing protein n=1 Tax=Hypothenemus hampei TaxID=57062 RepID=A0ABD1EE79_HYPHA